MSCNFALSGSELPLHFPSSSNTRRVSGPRPATRIRVFYAPGETNKESLYALLGVAKSESTTLSDIKRGYKEMAKKYHPDAAAPDRVEEHTRRFIKVKEAYDTLSNPQRRALYDRDLAMGPHQYDQRMEETGEWKLRWMSQLDELKRRNNFNSSRLGAMTWGARMRNRR